MSEVNSDGMLLNPEETLFRLACRRANISPYSPDVSDNMSRLVHAANGAPAGTVGGAPHMPLPRSTS